MVVVSSLLWRVVCGKRWVASSFLVPTDLFGKRRSRNGKQCRLEEVISARFYCLLLIA